MEQLYPTRKLTWPEGAKLAQKRVEEILHKEVPCQIALEDETYWTLYSPTYMFSTKELELLLQAVRATKEVWEEAIPQEGNASRSLGMEVTRLLLKQALHGQWSQEHCTEEGLWLLDYQEFPGEGPREPGLSLPGAYIPVSRLSAQRELLDYLESHGSTYSDLMNFCDRYLEDFHNSLCWCYPISDGVHMGTYLVPVREGVLSLPYDQVDPEDFEILCLEDSGLCNRQALSCYLYEWHTYSESLCQALHCLTQMADAIERKEP